MASKKDGLAQDFHWPSPATRLGSIHDHHNGFHGDDVSDRQPRNPHDRHAVSPHVHMTNREHELYHENHRNDWAYIQQDSSLPPQSHVHLHARRGENVNVHRADNLGGPHV